MGPNRELLCLRIEAERATETWCFNCTTDDGQSPEKKGSFWILKVLVSLRKPAKGLLTVAVVDDKEENN